MKKVNILCASGIGDALLMMTAYQAFREGGWEVTLFSDKAELITPLFPHAHCVSYPDDLPTCEASDLILLENDHSARAWALLNLRRQGHLSQLVVLFPRPSKMAMPQDFVFTSSLPFLDQLVAAVKTFTPCATKSNGLVLTPQDKEPQRIALHPTSANPRKNWTQGKFYALAKILQHKGYSPTFLLGGNDGGNWTDAPCEVLRFDTLLELAFFLQKMHCFIGNDSGLGHLASNVGTPTLTIGASPKRTRLWRPAWTRGEIVTPAIELPNIKKFRDHLWPWAVSVDKVMKGFEKLNIPTG